MLKLQVTSKKKKAEWLTNKTDEIKHIWLTLVHLQSFFCRLVSTVTAE